MYSFNIKKLSFKVFANLISFIRTNCKIQWTVDVFFYPNPFVAMALKQTFISSNLFSF